MLAGGADAVASGDSFKHRASRRRLTSSAQPAVEEADASRPPELGTSVTKVSGSRRHVTTGKGGNSVNKPTAHKVSNDSSRYYYFI